jgi:DNA-binding NtrC family response regulator
MTRILSAPSDNLTDMSACPGTPRMPAPRLRRPRTVTDVLSVGANATLHVYLSGLFQRFHWTVSHDMSFLNALRSIRRRTTAVVVCEEQLPDGSWRSWASRLRSVPDAPELIVVGDDRSLRSEVLALGGFDALMRPLREADVVWAVASAWHQWRKQFEDQGGGGLPCSGA